MFFQKIAIAGWPTARGASSPARRAGTRHRPSSVASASRRCAARAPPTPRCAASSNAASVRSTQNTWRRHDGDRRDDRGAPLARSIARTSARRRDGTAQSPIDAGGCASTWASGEKNSPMPVAASELATIHDEAADERRADEPEERDRPPLRFARRPAVLRHDDRTSAAPSRWRFSVEKSTHTPTARSGDGSAVAAAPQYEHPDERVDQHGRPARETACSRSVRAG